MKRLGIFLLALATTVATVAAVWVVVTSPPRDEPQQPHCTKWVGKHCVEVVLQ